MASKAALALVARLKTSRIDATRSDLHAARARAEAETHAEIVARTLALVGLTPEQVVASLEAHAAARAGVPA